MKYESDWQWKQEKKKKTGMQLWIMKAEWAMMKDEWQMMKNEWQKTNDERRKMNDEGWMTNSLSLLLILSISLSHSPTNSLCLLTESLYQSFTQSLNQSFITHSLNHSSIIHILTHSMTTKKSVGGAEMTIFKERGRQTAKTEPFWREMRFDTLLFNFYL